MGGVIDKKTKEEHLKKWSNNHHNNPSFYMMYPKRGWYIDTREVANMAHFINHSCDPNCKLVPVNFMGRMHVSIMSIKDVPPGGFLCYDYQFDTHQREKFIYHCSAKNCQGSMEGALGKALGDFAAANEKSQRNDSSWRRMCWLNETKKFLWELYKSEKDMLSLTGTKCLGWM